MGNVTVIGSLNYDICVSVERIPAIGETLLGKSAAYNCGGKGGNQAYACAQAGANTQMAGAVGCDVYGSILRESLQSVGVNVKQLMHRDDAASGSAIVTVDDAGRNHIVVIPGANNAVSPEYIHGLRGLLENSQVALLQLEIPQESVYAAIETAKAAHCLVVLNPAPARAIAPEYLAQVDYLTPNETELALLCPGGDDLEEKAARLIDCGVGHMVVTLGERGVLYMNADKQAVYYPAHTVRAVDTVGAGDCFNGYFSAAIAAGKPVGTAIQEAVLAASISVTRRGAQQSFPSQREIAALTAESALQEPAV